MIISDDRKWRYNLEHLERHFRVIYYTPWGIIYTSRRVIYRTGHSGYDCELQS